jgi:hypothetical protein
VTDLWRLWRGWPAREPMEDALGGALFNLQGLAHEYERRRIEDERGVNAEKCRHPNRTLCYTYCTLRLFLWRHL